jgi:hypothetical protein
VSSLIFSGSVPNLNRKEVIRVHLSRLLNRLGLAFIAFVLMEIGRSVREPTLTVLSGFVLLGFLIAFAWSALCTAHDLDRAIEWTPEPESEPDTT